MCYDLQLQQLPTAVVGWGVGEVYSLPLLCKRKGKRAAGQCLQTAVLSPSQSLMLSEIWGQPMVGIAAAQPHAVLRWLTQQDMTTTYIDNRRTAPALTDWLIPVIAIVGVVGAVVTLGCAESCQFRSSCQLSGLVTFVSEPPVCQSAFEVGAKVTLPSALAWAAHPQAALAVWILRCSLRCTSNCCACHVAAASVGTLMVLLLLCCQFELTCCTDQTPTATAATTAGL